MLLLKEVFDEYDGDGFGTISLNEMRQSLIQKKEDKARAALQSKDLAVRQAAAGIDIADVVEPLFRTLDRDGDGEISFPELLAVLFPLATHTEMETMLSWVKKGPQGPNELPLTMSEEQLSELRAIFDIFDTDGSGALTLPELQAALASCGMTRGEIRDLFESADVDQRDGHLDFCEFVSMMTESEFL